MSGTGKGRGRWAWWRDWWGWAPGTDVLVGLVLWLCFFGFLAFLELLAAGLATRAHLPGGR